MSNHGNITEGDWAVFESSNTTGNGGILRSETYLTVEYEPDEPVGREQELEKMAEAVRPISRGRQGENLLIYGPAGIGKTTCTRHVLNQLESNTRAKTVYINCWQYNTRSSLLTELLIQLGYPAPRKGKPVDELLSKVREWLDRNRGVVVALDEFDQLDSKGDVVYDLQLVNEEAESPISLLMISNRQPSTLNLDPRSSSRLNCQTLQFKPYNAAELKQILEHRVEQAFRPGTVPDEVLEEISRQAAENNGDCREALKTLLQAGRKADQKGERELVLNDLNSD